MRLNLARPFGTTTLPNRPALALLRAPLSKPRTFATARRVLAVLAITACAAVPGSPGFAQAQTKPAPAAKPAQTVPGQPATAKTPPAGKAAPAATAATAPGQAGAGKPPAAGKSTPKPAPTAAPPAAAAKPPDVSPPAFVKPNRPLAAITAAAYSPDGKHLAVGTFGEVVVYDTVTWQQSAIFRQVQDAVRTLAFNRDNQTLAIGSGLPGRTGQTVLWDMTGAQKPKAFPDQYDAIESVAFEKTGKSLLIGADDNKVRYVSDTSAGPGTVLDSHNGRVQAVGFSPKENTIFVTGAMDKIVKVWDMKTVKNVINFDQSEGGITGLAFLNNGDQFVGSSLDGRLYWWGVNYDKKKDAYNGYHFRTIGAHNGPVYSLSQSADGNRIITGGEDHAVCVWDTNSGGQIRAFRDATTQPFYATALSPDGKIAVGGGRDGLLYVWDVDGNKPITTLVPPAVPVPAQPHPAAHPKLVHSARKRRK
jgi:hypothetical protein